VVENLEKFIGKKVVFLQQLKRLYTVKLQNCKECEYSSISVNKVKKLYGKIGKKRLLIISQNPSYFWLQKNYDKEYVMGALDSFNRRFNNILNEYLSIFKLSLDDFFITNALKCATFQNESPKWSNTKKCSKIFLSKEIAFINPKKIFVLGNLARKAVEFLNISEKYKTYFFQHPSSIRDKNSAVEYCKHFVRSVLEELS